MSTMRGIGGFSTPPQGEPSRLRFGPFEADAKSGELWKRGVRVKLQLQPFKLLVLLASHPGELFTREQLQEQLWPDGTTVQFNQALNFCVKQIRIALDDQAASPRYVETLPKRGYRWIAEVERIEAPRAEAPTAPVPFVARGGVAREPAPERPPALPRVERRGRAWPSLIAAALVGGLAVGARSLIVDTTPQAAVPVFQRLTFRQGPLVSARFGPAGQVLYSAAWEGRPLQMFLVVPGSPDERVVDAVPGRIMAVSENGEIASLPAGREVGTLLRTPLGGGSAKELVENVMSADWSADGSTLAVARVVDGVTYIELPVGTVVSDAVWPSALRLAPDGRRVAFASHPVPRDDRGSVVVVDRQGRPRELTREWGSLTGIAWSPRGDEVWFTAAESGTDAALRAVSADGGSERVLLPGFGRLVLHDTARDGRVLLERSTARLHALFSDGTDQVPRDLSWFDFSAASDISPDGSQLLITESGTGGGASYGVFLRPTDGGAAVRLGTGMGMDLSPDGEWVLAIPIEDPSRLDLLPTGPGQPRALRHASIVRYLWAGWLPDGKRVVFTAVEKGAKERMYVQDLEGEEAPRPVTPPGVAVLRDLVSPDGSVILARCPDLGRCLYPIDGGEPRPVKGIAPDTAVLWWDASGRALYVKEYGGPPLVKRLDLATGRSEPWRLLPLPEGVAPSQLSRIVGTPDGRAIAYSYFDRFSELYLVSGIR